MTTRVGGRCERVLAGPRDLGQRDAGAERRDAGHDRVAHRIDQLGLLVRRRASHDDRAGEFEQVPADDADQRIGEHAEPDSPGWARVRGVKGFVYSSSLLIVMATIWLGSWFAQSVTGWNAYNMEQLDHGEPALGRLQYVGTADFWESTLQNWQSEFLAVGSMVVLSIYLRQRGSPESKPVGSPHHATGVEG